MPDLHYRSGMTDPIRLQCLSVNPVTSAETVVNLTGISNLEVHLRRRGQSSVITLSGAKVLVVSASTGEIEIYPASSDLVDLGVYDMWIKYTDVNSKIISHPSKRFFELQVLEAF